MCLWNRRTAEEGPEAARLRRRGAALASMSASLAGFWAMGGTEHMHRQHWVMGILLGVQSVLLVSALVSLRQANLARENDHTENSDGVI